MPGSRCLCKFSAGCHYLKGGVGRSVVDDDDLAASGQALVGDALENGLKVRLGVVGDDEDEGFGAGLGHELTH